MAPPCSLVDFTQSSSSSLLIARAAPSASVRPEFPHCCFIESDRSTRSMMQPGVVRENVCWYMAPPGRCSARSGLLVLGPGADDGDRPGGAGGPAPLVTAAVAAEREARRAGADLDGKVAAARALDHARRTGRGDRQPP